MRIASLSSPLCLLALAAATLPAATPAFAQGPDCCVVPDNGNGTADLPPSCANGFEGGSLSMVDGLPPGATIQSQARLASFFDIFYSVGGSLGGEIEQFSGTLELDMTGTGALAGFSRLVAIPVQGESHAAPRSSGTPVQSFDTVMMLLEGQLPPGDPDFDLLWIRPGSPGNPSPGHTTLTLQPGNTWAVDSFFDIDYRIDFIGAPGGPFAGMSGSTTATIRLGTCLNPVPTRPATWGSIKVLY